MQLDDTCSRLEAYPAPSPTAVRTPLTGGFIIIAGMERWRCDASGDIIEYTEWKMPEERVVGKSPYKNVWWKE
jgi:hypothetical protein